ncbi:MAG: AtpZ/AtpI family protein [Candidatus Saccharibacteria bacterium]
MKKAADHPTTKSDPVPVIFTLGAIGRLFLSTLWRVAIPVLAFVIAGIAADNHFHTKPWLTLLGLVLSAWPVVQLIKHEIAEMKGFDS